MSRDPDFDADLAAYGGWRALAREQSLWAVWLYRAGRRLDRRPPGAARRWLSRLYWPLFRLVETVTGVSLPKGAEIGPGLRIWHFGGIFINESARIGARCVLRQGVTLGNRHPDGPSPWLGDDVEIGAYAQILGGVRVGHGARIGAMAVVLQDVPDGASAVGNPARVIAARGVRPSAAITADGGLPPPESAA
ncbi:serine O-acetyltransferase [Pseudaquabacterium rugosum]|uniref:Serine acetyltransferase n=1 Tax=Pseudaquabacterium rugosum TaxID=2984194 RepID=A0ABU9BHX9_9BURK